LNNNQNSQKESENLKKQITSLNTENENSHKSLNEKYTIQSSLIKKRTELQKVITSFSKDNQTGGKVLMQTYQYYTTLLDNMSLEHRRNINFSEMKRKEFQINKVVDQIKLRDDFIINATSEIKKKKIPFKINPEIVKSLDEIELEPLRLPVIVNNYNPRSHGENSNINSVYNSFSNPNSYTSTKNLLNVKKNNFTGIKNNSEGKILLKSRSPSPVHSKKLKIN